MDFRNLVKDAKKQISDCTKYAVDSIKHVCKAYGPRPCGAESEKKAQKYMMESLKEYSDSVTRETFEVHPEAFMSFVTVAGNLVIGATACNIFGFLKNRKMPSVVALGMAAGGFASIIGEFLLYKEILDPFFKKKESGNVIAVRKSKGETKRRIILAGHTDSAPEWTYTYTLGSHGSTLVGGTAIGGLLYTTVTTGIILLSKNKDLVKNLSLSQLAFFPAYILLYKFANHKSYVEGANDNLTGCYIAAAVMKFLDDNNIRFENTEVVAALVGGEEAGLRGSKAYFKAHPELRDDDIETMFLSIDTIRDEECMMIYNKDMTGMVKNDDKACRLVQNAAGKCGYDVPMTAIPIGATDAAAASQAGIPSASFVAMDSSPARYYHTRLDTADNLVPETIEKTLDITLQTVFDFDENGLNQ